MNGENINYGKDVRTLLNDALHDSYGMSRNPDGTLVPQRREVAVTVWQDESGMNADVVYGKWGDDSVSSDNLFQLLGDTNKTVLLDAHTHTGGGYQAVTNPSSADHAIDNVADWYGGMIRSNANYSLRSMIVTKYGKYEY